MDNISSVALPFGVEFVVSEGVVEGMEAGTGSGDVAQEVCEVACQEGHKRRKVAWDLLHRP